MYKDPSMRQRCNCTALMLSACTQSSFDSLSVDNMDTPAQSLSETSGLLERSSVLASCVFSIHLHPQKPNKLVR